MKIGISDIFYVEDLPSSMKNAFDFEKLPSFKSIMELNEFQIFDLLSNYNIVILCLHGENPNLLLSKLNSNSFRTLWKSRTFKIALWAHDDHVHDISPLLRFIDVFFFAHYSSIPKYEKIPNTFFLPVGYSRTSRTQLIGLMKSNYKRSDYEKFEFGSVYRSYPNFYREQIYFRIAKRLIQLGTTFEFANTADETNGINYINSVFRSATTINVPIKKDFNMRNLEALALNRTLLTTYSPEFDILNLPTDNVIFFNDRLKDFDGQIAEIREKSRDSSSWRYIADFHCHIHRQVEAIDFFLPGTKQTFIDCQNEVVADILPRRNFEASLRLKPHSFEQLKRSARIAKRSQITNIFYSLCTLLGTIMRIRRILIVFSVERVQSERDKGYFSFLKSYYSVVHKTQLLKVPLRVKRWVRPLLIISKILPISECNSSEISPWQNSDPETTLVRALRRFRPKRSLLRKINDDNEKSLSHFQSYKGMFDNAYLFGTGPSLAQVYKHDFSNGFKVVCNTTVRNTHLFAYLKPHIICAADPIYHFGTNPHASRFRKDLMLRLTEDSKLIFAYPEIFDGFVRNIFQACIPQLLPMRISTEKHLDSLKLSGSLPSTGNILNLMLLPIGIFASQQISLLGFDGRKEDDTYFWQNSSVNSYFTELGYLSNLYRCFYQDMIPKDDPFKYVRNTHGEELKIELQRLCKYGYSFRLLANSSSPGLSWLNER